MTESVVEKVEDMEWTRDRVYSVDMQGRDRIDYGENGSICFVDLDKKCIIMRFCSDDLKEKVFAILNTVNGKLTELPLDTGNNCFFWDYHDGWCYFEEDSGDGIYRIVAVSLEGERREIIALTSEKTAGSMDIMRVSVTCALRGSGFTLCLAVMPGADIFIRVEGY